MTIVSSKVGAPAAAVTPVDFSADTPAAIAKMREVTQAVDNFSNSVTSALTGIQSAVQRATDRFTQSWFGKWCKPVADWLNNILGKISNAIQRFVESVNKIVAKIGEIIESLGAPWMIRGVGKSLTGGMISNHNALSDALAVSNLKSPGSWFGPAAKGFERQAHIQDEHGGERSARAADSFSTAVYSTGDRAVQAINKFIKDLLKQLLSIAGLSLDVAKGAWDALVNILHRVCKIVSLVVAVITLIYSIYQLISEIQGSMADFKSAVAELEIEAWPTVGA